MSTADHYAALEVAHDAALADIKASFQRTSLSFHPDKSVPISDLAKHTCVSSDSNFYW
jgi:DnaJ-class molecular chaperone